MAVGEYPSDQRRLRLWGEPGLDGPVALSLRARGLLALIALTPGQSLMRRNAAALLWPDRVSEQALANLRQLLRDHPVLGHGDQPLLTIGRERLTLARGLTTDHKRLLDLAAAGNAAAFAQELDRTDPRFLDRLDGISEAFDDWLAIERRRAGEQLADAIRRALQTAIDAGDPAASALANAALRFDPCDEAIARLGFAADAAASDTAALERRMAVLRTRLASDLDADPAAATVAAYLAAADRMAKPPSLVPPSALPPARRRWPAAAIAAALAAGLGGAVFLQRPPVPAAPAVDAQTRRAEALTLSARQLIAARNRDAYAKAAELSRAAIADDPGYAPAWTELAIAVWMPAWWAEQDESGARDRIRNEAMRYVDRALALSPGLPRALAAKGLILNGPEAGKLLEQAVASDPPDADIWLWLSNWRVGHHDLRGALAACSRAVALAPTRHRIVSSYTQLAWLLGRDDLADAAIDRFAMVAADQFAVGAMRANRLLARGRLGAAAAQALPLLKTGPRDPARVLLTLAWMARATGDLGAVKALTATHPQLGKTYAAIWDPDGVEARLLERPDAFLDNVMADAESRSLLHLGKGHLLIDLAARHPARFVHDPAGSCCHDLGANMVVAMRQAGNAGAAALLARIERDTAAAAAGGMDDRLLPMQRMVLACLHGDAAAGRWLARAIDRGWRGQDIAFAADPAGEPACAAQASQPEFAAARARLRALVAAEKPRVAVNVAAAIKLLQQNPPVTPAADGR